MSMPAQKPHRSRQDYATPQPFIAAVQTRLGIAGFLHDFAADVTNAKAPSWWSVADDALAQSPADWAARCVDGWGWLNPPYTRIGRWAQQCTRARDLGASIAFLVRASVGANWYRDYIHQQALVLALNGRIKFMSDTATPYPTDCILVLYSPHVAIGFDVWTWKPTPQRKVA